MVKFSVTAILMFYISWVWRANEVKFSRRLANF
jgi:hypothetical protein